MAIMNSMVLGTGGLQNACLILVNSITELALWLRPCNRLVAQLLLIRCCMFSNVTAYVICHCETFIAFFLFLLIIYGKLKCVWNIHGLEILPKCTMVFGWVEPFGRRGGCRWAGEVGAGWAQCTEPAQMLCSVQFLLHAQKLCSEALYACRTV